VLAHAPSGETVFAACLRLFHSYPLAVRRHYAEHRYGSMVMMSGEAGAAGFFVLIMERDDLFAIRPWHRRDWARVEIRPREPVDDGVRRLIGSGVPVLRDGVLLGWVAGQQVRLWVDGAGRITSSPLRTYDIWADIVLAVVTVPIVMAVALSIAGGCVRALLNRRRLAGWDRAWHAVGPRWTRLP